MTKARRDILRKKRALQHRQRIRQLYAIDAEAKQASPVERLAALAALRAKASKPVIDEIRTWPMTQRTLPRSALGRTIGYTSGLWPGLVCFVCNSKIPLDTNSLERALRGVASEGRISNGAGPSAHPVRGASARRRGMLSRSPSGPLRLGFGVGCR